jgi:tyrosine-protein phosphatase
MKLPALRPIKTNPHGFAEVPNEAEEEDQEPNFDIPQSREEKPAAYPNGPICIYESGVYLYFEPTAEQAVSFDVIVNVASEVKNPFTSPSESQKDIDARRVDGPPAENPDFATLPERTKTASFDTQGSSPTTPKATPVLESTLPTELVINGVSHKIPEYIHMMWEHNTDIVPDLYKLVKTMDERVQQGKRVLVHCQCGVSRSASLIVAYGIYKNPGISVQEAYDAVKKRSKWIGPNMNLIMQLQEFRNGLIRQNDQRSHAGGFGFPRRSAGLSTGVSNGTNRQSPFDREVQAGSRTPRTAPLPPDVDMNMQRASTGNMFAVSPGPLSAPSGTFFSPDFRRSWASSQTHFDLSPRSSPKQGPIPYVDPTGQVVPVLSITDNGSVPPLPTESIDQDMTRSSADYKQSPVPNFSRQLPLRSLANNDGNEATQPQSSEAFLTAPSRPFGLDSLRSPTTTGFNIPPRSSHDNVDAPPLFSPRTTEFNIPPWPRNDDAGPQSSPPMSPRSTEFHMTPLKPGEMDDSYGLLSPRGTSFDLELSSAAQQQSWPADRSSQDFEVSSPIATEFPKDPFARVNDAVDNGLQSPRAAEFHMTPLKPRVANEDSFGLTSPRQFEFPSNPFDLTPPRNDDTETRRPSFQAILPPSHLAQPEASFNGFLSLDGTAQAQPTAPVLLPPAKEEPTKLADMHSRFDSLSTSESQTAASVEPITPPPHQESNEAWLSKDHGHGFLTTPSRTLGIKTRFSSPNLREQRRLQRLQTEMESKLPKRSPQPLQAADDLDTLMSPRAEEFTRNPFHFDLLKKDEDTSPASSNETIKDGSGRTEWQDPVPQFTPQKVAEDPRSPVQTGSSPITRNIWDVL